MADRRRGARRWIRRALSLLVVAVLVVVAATAARVVHAGRSDQAGAGRRADAIVVLGAAQYDGRPQQYLVARLDHARALYRAGTATRILTLGGKQPGDRFTEADAGQRYLVAHDVPERRILRVGEGNDTLQSVQAAARLMRERRWHSAVVVTDPWHELRSTTMLRDQGLAAFGSPTPNGPSVGGGAVTARYVARETLAYLSYLVRRTFA